jgi:hypothetical protein
VSTRQILLEEPVASVEAVQAWRCWTLSGSRDGSRVRLTPIAGDGRPWPAGRPASATCTRHRTHVVPSLACTCGLYAVNDPDQLRRSRDPAVLGTVALWGRVVEHERGFRARFGYPQRLRLLCYLCFSLWGNHAPSECAFVVRHRGGRMVPLCEPHLELSRRYEYRMRRVLPAGLVESALLSAYAVDPLREIARSPRIS